jgi:hypothetical protein
MLRPELPRFVLPGTWRRIDLQSEETTRASIRRLVAEMVGPADERAQVRRDVRDALETIGLEARERGAVELHLASEIAHGIPFEATLALFLVDTDVPQLRTLSDRDMATLLEGVEVADPGEASGKATILADRARALRHVYRRPLSGTMGGPGNEIVEVEYWLAAGYPARVAVLSFSTMFVDFQDKFIELCDAIVGTVQWPLAKSTRSAEAPATS